MFSHPDHFIHDLSVQTILTILKEDAWKVSQQTITSAVTNTKPEKIHPLSPSTDNTEGIHAFSDITFEPEVTAILDVGGGKYEDNRDYMKQERNIHLLVWDPYNRSHSHNTHVQTIVMRHKVMAATSMSVLNVIPDVEARLAHINTLKDALMIKGKAYFKMWPGAGLLAGSYLPSADDSSFQANAFADRFLSEIGCVFGRGNVELHSTIPNLVVAIKRSEHLTSRDDIEFMQQQSRQHLSTWNNVKKNSIDKIYLSQDIKKLFSLNLSFFKKMEDSCLETQRHTSSKLQQAYDQRFGLIKIKGC